MFKIEFVVSKTKAENNLEFLEKVLDVLNSVLTLMGVTVTASTVYVLPENPEE